MHEIATAPNNRTATAKPPLPQSARRSSIHFVFLACALSWTYLLVVNAGLAVPTWASPLILMWIPGTVSIVLRLVQREGFTDAGFRASPFSLWMWSYLGPMAIATLTYLLPIVLQQVQLSPYLQQQSMFGPFPFKLHWWDSNLGSFGLLAQRFIVTASLGITIGFVCGLGEEIGWRGYLLPRLIQGHVQYPILASGIIWAIWHMPFVLITFRHERYITALLYALLCLSFGVFVSWLRLASRSVFVAAMAHASYNSFYQDFFDHSFVGPFKWFWAGEVGLLASGWFLIVALWLYRSGRIKSLLSQAQSCPEFL
jgi:membrane protease YdiL (CAAX protease family)